MMVQQDGTAKELPMRALPATIGRGQECKLRIPLASVSRHHCELLEDDDELVVRDLKSSNGTYVNKERVARRELVPGDLLAVGPVVFVVRIDGHPKDIDAAASYAAGSVTPPAGGPPGAIDGVPTWSGQQGGSAEAHAAPAAPKPERKDDELSQIDSLLDELGESDFDIDLNDKPKR